MLVLAESMTMAISLVNGSTSPSTRIVENTVVLARIVVMHTPCDNGDCDSFSVYI